jgi:hypothetical protein
MDFQKYANDVLDALKEHDEVSGDHLSYYLSGHSYELAKALEKVFPAFVPVPDTTNSEAESIAEV